jgi:putative glutamine amidotransferase
MVIRRVNELARRPVIGLTTYAEEARFGIQDTFAAVLPMAYVTAVHRSGGRAVLITPDDPGTDVLHGLDGILFTGGSDVDPALYREQPHPTTRVKPLRDAAELPLMRAALAADLPLLGICRGMQLMAVAYGGRLHQHLPEVLGHHAHRPLTEPAPASRYGAHPVTLAPGSLGQKILGDSLEVNSFHHQGVANPGDLTPVGWCPDDELIEVVEDPARTFALGVQWHPEETPDPRLFAALVEAARERVERAAG